MVDQQQPTAAATQSGRILLVEDDIETARFVTRAFTGTALAVHACDNGLTGRDLALGEHWDCIILDRRLPGLDGLSILAALRAGGVQAPVLFLTTMDGVEDRVEGLRNGADDYLIKPFSVSELLARIDNLLRRPSNLQNGTRLLFADLELDVVDRTARRSGNTLPLQPQELRLLEYFMRHPMTLLSQKMLLQAVWGIDFPIRTNLVETHISRLRRNLGRDAAPLIHTVWGRGYILRLD